MTALMMSVDDFLGSSGVVDGSRAVGIVSEVRTVIHDLVDV